MGIFRKKNEPETLKDIFNKYGERIYKAAYLLVGNREDTEDLCQDVFCEYFKAPSAYKGRSSMFSWLYRIMLNLHYQRLRKKYKHRSVIENQNLMNEEIQDMLHIDIAGIEKEETMNKVWHAIAGLPDIYKSVVMLKYMHGLSYEDMAGVLGCPVGTIRSRLNKAKEKLKQELIDFTGSELL